MSTCLKKVIILAEYYPPCNLTGAHRPYSWVKYLKNYGYYPIVFCRNFSKEKDYEFIKNDFFEVHYLPYKEPYFYKMRRTLNNRLLRRFFGFLNYQFDNSIEYNGIKTTEVFISNYILQNQVEKLISTGPGYSVFGLSYKLHKKHKIKWIADYRDDWTTTELNSGFFFKLKNLADSYREKKYLSNCSCFTSVSPYYLEKISKLIKKSGYLIENGFEPEENLESSNLSNTNKFNILYPGLLYSTQKINIIGDALDLLPANIIAKIKFTFLGTETKSLKLPENLKKYLNKNVFFMRRIERSEANLFINNADVLLFLTHQMGKSLKGIPSSKLYDLIRAKKKVFVCPSDHDIVEQKLKETGQGIFCNTASELADSIKKMIPIKEEKGYIPLVEIPGDLYYSNTRKYQTEKLAHILDNL